MSNYKLKEFVKYHSLGNDFIIIDWLDIVKPLFHDDWQEKVRALCDRHYGIGADCVLVLTKPSEPQCHVFNADGSEAKMCLNGIRCIADYLVTKKNYSAKLMIIMGDRRIEAELAGKEIVINVGSVTYQKAHALKIADHDYSGHIAVISNPH